MQGSDISTESLRRLNVGEQLAQLKEANSRPLVKRLWESYFGDLTETVDAFNTGVITETAIHEQLSRLVPILENLRSGGRVAEALNRAQVVILDRVMEDVGT